MQLVSESASLEWDRFGNRLGHTADRIKLG